MNNHTHDPEDMWAHLLPAYDEILTFSADEFATAFAWAMNAVSGAAQLPSAANRGLKIFDEDGEYEYRFEDTPTTRVIMAMGERYGAGNRKYHSAIARITALLQLVGGGGLEPWVRPSPDDPDHTEIHDAVVAAAAVASLDEHLEFPVLEFMQTVRQIAARPHR